MINKHSKHIDIYQMRQRWGEGPVNINQIKSLSFSTHSHPGVPQRTRLQALDTICPSPVKCHEKCNTTESFKFHPNKPVSIKTDWKQRIKMMDGWMKTTKEETCLDPNYLRSKHFDIFTFNVPLVPPKGWNSNYMKIWIHAVLFQTVH